MNRRVKRDIPNTYRRNRVNSSPSIPVVEETTSKQESRISVSTVVKMKQLVKHIAPTKETPTMDAFDQEQYVSRVSRATAPPRSKTVQKIPRAQSSVLPSVTSVNIDEKWVRNTLTTLSKRIDSLEKDGTDPSLKKELWKVRDQISGIQSTLKSVPNTQSLVKDVSTVVMKSIKVPEAKAAPPVDVAKIKKEVADAVMKSIKVPEAKSAPPVDVAKIKKEVADAVMKSIKVPEEVDINAVKKEVADAVMKSIKVPEAKAAPPVDINAVKKEVTDAVMKSIKVPEEVDIKKIVEDVITSVKKESIVDANSVREDLMSRIQELTTVVNGLLRPTPETTGVGQTTTDRLICAEKEIRSLRTKICELGNSIKPRIEPGRSPRSGSRTRARADTDQHRLSSLPLFSTDLVEDLVIEGGSQVHPLIRNPEWSILKDSEHSFDMSAGYYVAPFPGNYNIVLILKTISTSVTAHISVEHQDKHGNIRRVYALDQSSLTDESTGQVMLMDVNTHDRICVMIQTRFNMKLVGREMITQEGTGKEYPEIYNVLQITYFPHRGFCEVPPTEVNTRA